MDPNRKADVCGAGLWLLSLLVTALPLRADSAGPGFAWMQNLQPVQPGSSAPLFPFTAKFVFGWSGIPAGHMEVEFSTTAGAYRATARGGTSGTARRLWKLDAIHEAGGQTTGLRPTGFRQEEKYARHTLLTEAEFFPDGSLRRKRGRTSAHESPKWKNFPLHAARDLLSTMLFVRSQPLEAGDEVALICFPGDSPYLVQVRSEGRTSLQIGDGEKAAILLNLRMQRVETKAPHKGELTRHSKFRSGKIWLSDDAYRMPLRCEVAVFIGYVFGELTEWSAASTP